MLSALRLAPEDPTIVELLNALNTPNRPQLSDDPAEEGGFCDWVLVRRKGVELGFADSAWFNAEPRMRWGTGDLILTQVYFYTAFDDVQTFEGELPFGLNWGDDREKARQKLSAFESARHSGITDTWDTDLCRITVQYKDDFKSLDRIFCRVDPKPMPPEVDVEPPALETLQHSFGLQPIDPAFRALWGPAFQTKRQFPTMLDMTRTLGVELYFQKAKELDLLYPDGKLPAGLVFAAVRFLADRQDDAAGWKGALPEGLSFDDSPEELFQKIPTPPDARNDAELIGSARWHRPTYSLHVLYSHVDNRLLRVTLAAPGYWKKDQQDA